MLRSLNCCVCNLVGRNVLFQQVANYNIPPLPETVLKRLESRNKITRKEIDEPFTQKGNEPITVQISVRRAWALHGSSSGIDPAVLFPSEFAVSREMQAEKRWWPTLQQMQKKLKYMEQNKKLRYAARQQKIAENLEKMPGWIEKFRKEQKGIQVKAEEQKKKRDIDIEKAQEVIGYNISPRHPGLQGYLRSLKEKQKQEVKTVKKERRSTKTKAANAS